MDILSALFYLSCDFYTLFVLLNQDLREECLKLRTRVFDLEQQNRALGVLFQQKIKPASDLLLQVRCPSQTYPPVDTLLCR